MFQIIKQVGTDVGCFVAYKYWRDNELGISLVTVAEIAYGDSLLSCYSRSYIIKHGKNDSFLEWLKSKTSNITKSSILSLEIGILSG